MLSICALGSGGVGSGGVGSGKSAASMLRVLLIDAPERARVDLVSRLRRRCFEEMEGVRVRELLTRSGGVGLLPRPLPSEDEEAASGEVGGRREPIAVSDLYRGRVGRAADALTPAEAERDRRRTTVYGAAGDCGCVIGEGDIGEVIVTSESEDWKSWGSES